MGVAEFHRRPPTMAIRRGCVRALATVAGVALIASGVAAGAQYQAVDLYAMHPPAGLQDAAPHSAFAGQVVGRASVPTEPEANPPPPHAVLWTPDGRAVDLTLEGFDATTVVGTNGTRQFGWGTMGRPGFFPVSTPVVWSGSAASATFLSKQGFASARVGGGGGDGQFVGSGEVQSPGSHRALLWNDLTAQPVDLTPENLGFVHHFASGAGGGQQVGYAQGFDDGNNAYYHALLWSGSAASAVDLHPTHLAGITNSEAVATDGQQQVGNGGPDLSFGHALLWSGSGDSAVILTPPGFVRSTAFGVRDGKQVGFAREQAFGIDGDHAMLWSGAADSAIDLHLLLPDGYTSSRAYGIDHAGHVFGVAFHAAEQRYHAIEWAPVPEPASLALLMSGGFALLARRRRRAMRTQAHAATWARAGRVYRGSRDASSWSFNG